MKTNRSNKLFDQTRIATLGLQDLLAFGQLQPDGTYKVRNVTNSNFLNAIVISEQITYAEILALATASELVAGKNYTITNAVSGTLSLYIFAVSTSKLAEYGYDTTTGQVYSYDLATDTATNADNTGYINFTPQTAPAYQRGRVWYDSTTETLSVYDDISGTSVQLGQEEILRARNSTGSTILNGAVVYVSGAQGQNPRVSLALANAESTSRVIGVATHNISNNSVGKITTFGIVGDLNTSAYNEGDVLYLSASVAGGLTTTRPSAPNQAVMVGTVIHAAVNDGKILVHTDNYGIGFGTANQVRGMNAAGTAEEYKTIQGTASEVEILHTANTVTIGLPNAVTISGAMTAGSFVKSGGVSAQFLKADGTVDANAYFYTNAQVTGQALTGLSVSGSAVVSTDSILTGIGKLQNQINAVLGSVNFQGVWNASTNTPTLTSSVGTKGYYYIVTVAGSTNLNGITDWKLGDWAIYDGTAWQKVDNTDAVVSVNGYTGIVTLAAADVGALPTSAISGTTGKLPKFTASGTIGDSIVSESGGVISVAGNIELPNGALFISAGSGNNYSSRLSTAYNFPYVDTYLDSYAGASYEGRLWLRTNSAGGAMNSGVVLTNSQLITFGAANTGEAHIFGGSARVNGNLVTNAGYIQIRNSSNPSLYINNENIQWQQYVNSSNNLVFSDAISNVLTLQYNTGNVGIGTTSPSQGKLEVNGDISINNLNVSNNALTNAVIGYFKGDARLNGAGASFGGMKIITDATLWYRGRLGFFTNNIDGTDPATPATEKMSIMANGNVGVGTTSPTDKFQMNGGKAIFATSNFNGTTTGGAVFVFSDDNNGGKIWAQKNGNSDWGYLALQPSGGNVGIGTTSPNVALEIGIGSLSNATTNQYFRVNSGTYNALSYSHIDLFNFGNNFGNPLGWRITGGTEAVGVSLGRFLSFNSVVTDGSGNPSTATERARFSSNGNFLINTTTDDNTNKLQVAGSVKIGGNITMTPSTSLIYGGDTVGLVAMTNSDLASYIRIFGSSYAGTPNDIEFITNSVKRLTIASTGAATFSSSVQATTLKLTSLPTSSAGLSAGDIWNDSGTLKIV